MSNHYEEEPTIDEYLDAINNRTQDLYDKLNYITDKVEDIPNDNVNSHRMDIFTTRLSLQEDENSKTIQILLLVCIILLGVILYKVW